MARLSGFHLYLVRHGESANNALPEHQRVEDPDLTELGQKQACQLANHYVDLSQIDHVLTSPFRRTLQTTQPLLRNRGMRASVWSGIYEVGGCYSGYEVGNCSGEPGMTDTEIRDEFPEFDIPDDKKLRDQFEGKDNVVFCFIHADFKQLLLQQLVPAQTEYHHGGIPNSSVTNIQFDKGCGRVVDYCNVDHLQPDDVSY